MLMLATAVPAPFITTVPVACALLPELPLRIIYFRNPSMFKAAPLVPWYVACSLLIALANVLVSNLMAQEKFNIVPRMLMIGLAYITTLLWCSQWLISMEPFNAFRTVIAILGFYSLLALLTASWFTWGKPASIPSVAQGS